MDGYQLSGDPGSDLGQTLMSGSGYSISDLCTHRKKETAYIHESYTNTDIDEWYLRTCVFSDDSCIQRMGILRRIPPESCGCADPKGRQGASL